MSATDSDGAVPQVILGSASPARLTVLRNAGLAPRVVVSDVDEDALFERLVTARPDEIVVRLAQAKADAIIAELAAEEPAPDAQAIVLTCDSMLLFDGALTGKPHLPDVAVAQWRRMRGHSGELITGHCVSLMRGPDVVGSAHRAHSTVIHFDDVDDASIDAYVATGEPLEVAGAFTLDGLGGWFIRGIEGDPSSVLGISLPTVAALLRELDVDVTTLWRD
ncbi:septum formation inhibitor Maf [Gordonia sp. TBRC 11910]|uniref:Nucleoside triphosphate pyrophosphatase n=1 Tax=Gordonia asplenii TaxID=2725283 RepID=A0A848L0B0_9ACTN|nr:Maf family protein [Gordonia asplenii]NMO01128.1 septum formation inhibitor Maf [Gordonia asplenii]